MVGIKNDFQSGVEKVEIEVMWNFSLFGDDNFKVASEHVKTFHDAVAFV